VFTLESGEEVSYPVYPVYGGRCDNWITQFGNEFFICEGNYGYWIREPMFFKNWRHVAWQNMDSWETRDND